MKSTEDHLREMLSERADRVRPGPVPEELLRESDRPARRVRVPALLAAAAVVAVVAAAALVPLLGRGGDGPPAPAASGSNSPTPDAASSKLPATSRYPAAGVCGQVASPVVTVRIEPDVPMPRCVQVRGDQSLRVVNRTGDYGQNAHPVRVRWLPGRPVRLAPGQSHHFPRRFDDYLERGVHDLRITRAYAGQIWLR